MIDAYVDSIKLDGVGIKPEPAGTGRPPYNPRDMLKLYIYGYFNRIRSSRRLEKESGRNIELMWLICRLVPDYKTISRFRRDNVKALKAVFRDFVKLCRKLELYGNELLAIDGSKFKAVNSLDNNFNHKRLDDRLKRIDEKLDQYLSELNENDNIESDTVTHSKEEIAGIITELTERKQKYEILKTELTERKQKYEKLKTELTETEQTQISTVDPDARRMKTANKSSEMCYNIQTAVDSKNKLIAEYEVTNHCTDKNLLTAIAVSAKETLGADAISVTADNGYFVATDIANCIQNGITPHVSSEHDSITFCVPATAEEAASETNTPKEFNNKGKHVYVSDRNVGICPMGNIMYPQSYSIARGSAVYRNANACRNCPQRAHCKSYYDRQLEVTMAQSAFTKEYNDTELFVKQIIYVPDKTIMRKRKSIAEHPFGTIKRNMDSAYCLLKRTENVRGEFALTYLVYNLKRAINILGVTKLLQAIRVHGTFILCCYTGRFGF